MFKVYNCTFALTKASVCVNMPYINKLVKAGSCYELVQNISLSISNCESVQPVFCRDAIMWSRFTIKCAYKKYDARII